MPSASTATEYRLYVGLDIAATSFTATWRTSHGRAPRPQPYDQGEEGPQRLMQALKAIGVAPEQTRIVMEATGVYWVGLAGTLHEAGYVVCVVNPAQARDFAKGLGQRAKTDALDALALCELAATRTLSPWTPPPDAYHQLRQRLVTREALQTVRHQLFNQRHALDHWPVVVDSARDHLTALIDDLDTRIRQLEAEIQTQLTDSEWRASATLLLTIPGIGLLTTAWLLVSTVNFTLCPTPEAAVNYAGLAPQPYASGTSVYRRPQIGHTGHARLRTALYLATLSATRFNPPIAAFYDRLCKAGKPKKVARCAAARKLLHQAWAVVTKQRPFDPNWGKVSEPLPETP